MLRQCRTRIMHSMINFCAGKVGFLTPPRTIASRVVPSANLRALCTMDTDYHPELSKISEEKRSLRTVIRRELKKMDPIRRSEEGASIFDFVSMFLFGDFIRVRKRRFLFYVFFFKIIYPFWFLCFSCWRLSRFVVA